MAVHTVDEHYELEGPGGINVGPPKVVPVVVNWGINNWAPAPGKAAWIGPNPYNSDNPVEFDLVGEYKYELIFNLKHFDTSSLRIKGLWATDNTGKIYLNGIDTGLSRDERGYDYLLGFEIFDGMAPGVSFQAKVNRLTFEVGNTYSSGTPCNPSGLLVSFTEYADGGSFPSEPVPDAAHTGIMLLMVVAPLCLRGRHGIA